MQREGRRCEACGQPLEAGADACGACEARGDTAPLAGGVEDRGRRQIVAVAVSLLGAMVVLGVLGAAPLPQVGLQVFVLGLVFLQLFRGRPWARWLLVALAGLWAVSAGAQGALALGSPDQPWLLGLALAVVYAASAAVLVLSKPVARFLEAQRARHG